MTMHCTQTPMLRVEKAFGARQAYPVIHLTTRAPHLFFLAVPESGEKRRKSINISGEREYMGNQVFLSPPFYGLVNDPLWKKQEMLIGR